MLENKPRRLDRCNNIADLRHLARRKLPAPMFHYIDGGYDDEWTLRNNTSAFDDYELLPNYLFDIANIDTSTTVLGRRIEVALADPPLAHKLKAFRERLAAKVLGESL